MTQKLPLCIVEPDSAGKRAEVVSRLFGARFSAAPMTGEIDAVKRRLKDIRKYSRENLNGLVEELKANLGREYPSIKVTSASDADEAVKYIAGISDGIDIISTNSSAVVAEELKAGLVGGGFTVVNSYLDEYDIKDRKAPEFWDITEFREKNISGTFDIATRLDGLPGAETKKYLAVLGVNAISSADLSVFFLQHLHNIHNDLLQAKKVILIVGLDKIVKTGEDAAFQTKCMGVFGMENRVLDVQPRPDKTVTVAELPVLPAGEDRELHLIILDNGRTGLVQSDFKDLFLCIGCRTCNISCPAYRSGKPLRPREMVLNLKKHLSQVGSELLRPEGEAPGAAATSSGNGSAAPEINKDEIWACTTCHACQEECPVELKHSDAIIGLRQNLVMDQAVIPATAEAALRSIEARGHPWRGTRFTRTSWAEGLGINSLSEDGNFDILYWVGCTEALEDRGMKVAQAVGKLLTRSGMKVGILGAEESCCGDPARRLGNEYLFQLQAQKNVDLMKRYNVKKIVTGCPHCYNTLKNEYPAFGGEFEVVHHTQFIAGLLAQDKIRIAPGDGGLITYHDPCYLGRYNGVYEPPRQILRNAPGVTLIEMEQNRKKSFCCGGGGGRMWLEEGIGRRISELRVERAGATQAQIVATACPFCLQMFDDAIKSKALEGSLKVMDIAELASSPLKSLVSP